MLAQYPKFDESKVDAQAEIDIEWLKGVISGIRNIRAAIFK